MDGSLGLKFSIFFIVFKLYYLSLKRAELTCIGGKEKWANVYYDLSAVALRLNC